MSILQRIPLGDSIQISPPGHFVTVNSHRSMEQNDEEVHHWEGYLCTSAWLCGLPKNPQSQS